MKQNRFTAILIAMMYLFSGSLFSQTFIEVSTSIQALVGSSDWGDFDSDGDLDLLITGTTSKSNLNAHTNLYSNLGNGQFAFVAASGLSGMHSGTARWIDFNNDDILDIITSGMYLNTSWQQYLPTTRLYIGKGNKTFELTDQSFESLSNTSIGWSDFNNDGKVDLALSGYNEVAPFYRSKVYVNQSDTFSEYPAFEFAPCIYGNITWADYDGDNDMDMLITGWNFDYNTSQNVYRTEVYRNDGEKLTFLKDLSLMGTANGSAEWGDFDNDGDLDILVSGSIGFGSSATGYLAVYRNDGNDSFNKTDFQGISTRVFGVSKWGDMDNDGDLDIVVCSRNQQSTKGYTYLYKNTSSSYNQSTEVCELFGATLDLVDYDKDGDLDIFVMGGLSDITIQKKLLKNTINNKNLKPDTPSGLTAKINNKEVLFSWNPSTDDHTPSNGLTYNILVGSQPEAMDIMAPNSNISTGYRKLVRIGNSSADTCWKLNFDNAQKYYWRVQAIDQSYVGSSFSETSSFSFETPIVFTELPTDITSNSATFNGRVNTFSLNASAYFEYGTDTANLFKTFSVQIEGDSMYNVAIPVFSLVQDTLYYCRLVALNENDTVYGNFVTFRTYTDGIEEFVREIALFPNPGNGIFNFSIPYNPEGIITIYDQAGRKQLQLNSKETGYTKRIDISHFETGIYVFVFRTEKYSYHCTIEKL